MELGRSDHKAVLMAVLEQTKIILYSLPAFRTTTAVNFLVFSKSREKNVKKLKSE